mgnify:CR=1 FL=1
MDKIKLFVDDLRRCPDGWQPARTITEAIRILAMVPVEEVILDHDIQIRQEITIGNSIVPFEFSSQETFEPVAYYLAMLNKLGRGIKISFHTSNPLGESNMRRILGL